MKFPYLSLLLFLSAGCAATETQPVLAPTPALKATTVPFQYSGGVMLIPAILNGKVQADFMVDTGAAITMISRAKAKELGIDLSKNLPVIQIYTASETIQVPLMVLDSVEVGGLVVKDVTIAIHDNPNPGRPGLLGVNFLNHFRVEIDMKEGVLLLERK